MPGTGIQCWFAINHRRNSKLSCMTMILTLTCLVRTTSSSGDFCNNLQERFQYWGTTSCSELPIGFRLYNSNGLGWNGYSFDDQSTQAGQNQPRNVCRWALFGNGGEWELDVLDTSFGTADGPSRPHFYGNCAMTGDCSSCMNDELWSGIHYTSSITKGNKCAYDDGDTDASWSAVECHLRHYASENLSSRHWISVDLINTKTINHVNFFGFECPPGEMISAIKVQRYQQNSHLHNSPTEVQCSSIRGTHQITETCVNQFTQDTGTTEDAFCSGNSVISGIYDTASLVINNSDYEYDQTMAHRCCQISECVAEYCNEGNGLSINASSCVTIGHTAEPQSEGEISTLTCPETTVLTKIIDIDVAIGVQQVYEIECCNLVQVAPPSKSPSANPSYTPSLSPTTTCMDCLITLHKENIPNELQARSRYQECLDDHCCNM